MSEPSATDHPDPDSVNGWDIDSDQSAFSAEFPSAKVAASSGRKLILDRFQDVTVTISAELGRVAMPIGELLQLTEGAVVELERNVSEPVDIMAQGVRIGGGEVVVVDDRYGIRITEIEEVPSPVSTSNP